MKAKSSTTSKSVVKPAAKAKSTPKASARGAAAAKGAVSKPKAKAAPAPKPKAKAAGSSPAGGARDQPWRLKTPSGSSEYSMYRDETLDPPALVCVVGTTELRYHLRCLEDLHTMLRKHGDWMMLGSADEQKPAAPGTVEAWARSADNPVGGWYGLKKGLRGRFAMYVPPLMEMLGLAELEHNAKNNRMRAK
jgi:hypothetical protein